jgi:hypothetical protein
MGNFLFLVKIRLIFAGSDTGELHIFSNKTLSLVQTFSSIQSPINQVKFLTTLISRFMYEMNGS